MDAKYEGLPKYKLHLCPGCIKDLDEYYPYVMPREMLDIKEVSIADCDNTCMSNSNSDEYTKRMMRRNPEWKGVLNK